MSKIEVDAIDKQSGSTLTLGGSGTAVTLASGATQSGFGRTGTVDWDTTAKTASFTAVSGNGYFVNTTSGAITVTLPAGSAGDIVSLADYAGTWQTNGVTITPNGTDKIGGVNISVVLSTEGQSVTLLYADSTQGWLNTMDSTSNVRGSAYVTATGGTITTCGDYKIHTFTSPGTFCVSAGGGPSGSNTVDYLVVAGGGGANMSGGGGGGVRFTNSTYTIGSAPAAPRVGGSALSVPANPYPITVGAGGAGTVDGTTCGTRGSNSIFSTITSTGGGGGGKYNGPGSCAPQTPGGSGGGGQSVPGCSGNTSSQGAGNTPPVAPPQGTPGGISSDASVNAVGSAGGGGMMAAGGNASSGPSSDGGNAGAGGAGGGFPSAFGTSGQNCGSYYYFAGGGGGGAQKNAAPGPSSAGGIGGGGAGKKGPNSTGTSGTVNTGGGGGGWGGFPSSACGGTGGSGIVIIRYKFQN